MKKFHIERLRKLAKFLRTVPRKRFNIDFWTDENTDDKFTCNTIACAGGWACSMPIFRKRGLKLDNYGPTFGRFKDYDALSLFFGLSLRKTESIFNPDEYDEYISVTPKMVAKKIESVINEYQRGT